MAAVFDIARPPSSGLQPLYVADVAADAASCVDAQTAAWILGVREATRVSACVNRSAAGSKVLVGADIHQDFTIQGWFKTDVPASFSTQQLFCLPCATPRNNFGLLLRAGRLRSWVTGGRDIAIPDFILDDEWHHYSVSTDGLGHWCVFVDGSLLQSRMGPTIAPNSRFCAMLGNHLSDLNSFNGLVSNVQLWTGQRTAEQIAQDMCTAYSGGKDRAGVAVVGLKGSWLLGTGLANEVVGGLGAIRASGCTVVDITGEHGRIGRNQARRRALRGFQRGKKTEVWSTPSADFIPSVLKIVSTDECKGLPQPSPDHGPKQITVTDTLEHVQSPAVPVAEVAELAESPERVAEPAALFERTELAEPAALFERTELAEPAALSDATERGATPSPSAMELRGDVSPVAEPPEPTEVAPAVLDALANADKGGHVFLGFESLTAAMVTATLNGGGLIIDRAATVSDWQAQSNNKKAWLVYSDGISTKGVRVEFSVGEDRHLQVKALEAAWANGNRVGDWTSARKVSHPVATSNLAAGYGVKSLQILGVEVSTDYLQRTPISTPFSTGLGRAFSADQRPAGNDTP